MVVVDPDDPHADDGVEVVHFKQCANQGDKHFYEGFDITINGDTRDEKDGKFKAALISKEVGANEPPKFEPNYVLVYKPKSAACRQKTKDVAQYESLEKVEEVKNGHQVARTFYSKLAAKGSHPLHCLLLEFPDGVKLAPFEATGSDILLRNKYHVISKSTAVDTTAKDSTKKLLQDNCTISWKVLDMHTATAFAAEKIKNKKDDVAGINIGALKLDDSDSSEG